MDSPAPLTEEIAAFAQGGVSIVASSRDANLQPSLARVFAFHASPDRRHVTIVVSAPQAAALLADVEACGQIAVAITEPSTHRSYQVKGRHARVQTLRPFDHAACEQHTELFLREVCPLGFTEPLVRAVLDIPPSDRVAISFTPEQSFSQTPGTTAGVRLA